MSRSIYFSVDIETDGVVAGRNNMLSLGAAAIDMLTGEIVGTFKLNLKPVPDLKADQDTLDWWAKQDPKAWRAARENPYEPDSVMRAFVDWVKSLETPDSVIFAWKPTMDLAFVRYYIHRFHPQGVDLTINDIFGRKGFGLDQKTVAAIALQQRYRNTKVGDLPKSLRVNEEGEVMPEHDHDALHDAIEQAYIFYNSVRRLGVDL